MKKQLSSLAYDVAAMRTDISAKTVEIAKRRKESLLVHSVRDSHRNEQSQLSNDYNSKKGII